MKILFVDDTLNLCQMFAVGLRSRGHDVHLGFNGLEAVEAVRSDTFDALVMDVEMPFMDGWEAVLKIRELDNGAQLPIILLTASSVDASRNRAKEVNVDLLLRKPMLPSNVLTHIEKLIVLRAA